MVIYGHHSVPKQIISDVPQGSVLGPILFILYINDLQSVVNSCKVGSFADDTKKVSKIDTTDYCLKVQFNIYKMSFIGQKRII